MRQHRSGALTAVASAGALLFGIGGGAAQDAGLCSGMAWSVDAEVAVMSAPETVAAKTGASLPTMPTTTITLGLEPTRSVSMPVAPAIKPKAVVADTFSGWIAISRLQGAGLYQISMSENAWIDAVQNGELIQSSGFTGKRECPTVRKSVRFPIGDGPVILQLTGVPTKEMKITVRRAEAP